VDSLTRDLASFPAPVARMLAVEILLADPEALGDDVLESSLYLLREKLRAAQQSAAPLRILVTAV
jgi:hypothetical protein